jgi:acetyl esterase
MARILDDIRARPAVDLKTLPMAEARLRFMEGQLPFLSPPPAVASVTELQVPGAAGPMRARLCRPTEHGTLPLVLYLHGGGWTFGSIDSHDRVLRSLAVHSGAAVLGIDYRLAPEHPFPAPLDDALAAIEHVRQGGLGGGIDTDRLALAGDSAGANLALGALVALRDRGLPLPATAGLFYGCYAPDFDTESHRRFGDGTYLLSTVNMQWYWRNFLGARAESEAPGACAPLRADLSALPPLYLNAAGLDPLLDDTTLLAGRLAQAGSRFTLEVFPGVVHGFLRFARDLPAGEEALHSAGRHIGRHLNQR